jgi:hypothetical protein
MPGIAIGAVARKESARVPRVAARAVSEAMTSAKMVPHVAADIPR